MRMRASAILLALLVSACGDDAANDESAPAASADGAATRVGVIVGVVRIAEGAELPGYDVHPMVPTPPRPPMPDDCSAASEADRRPVTMDAQRGLEGVLVALSDFGETPAHAPVTHELRIRDCRLTPRLVVATRGDGLRIHNESDYPFLPDFGTGMMQAILRGDSREVELGMGGVRTLTCGWGALCGRAEIVTLYHPLHDITAAHGRFRIEGVPPGDAIRVSAWHPLFQEAAEVVDVTVGATREVELVLRPSAPAPTPSPPAPDLEGPAEDHPDEILF